MKVDFAKALIKNKTFRPDDILDACLTEINTPKFLLMIIVLAYRILSL